MGRRSINVTTNRSEFLPSEGENSDDSDRNGGCFVTTKKALLLAVLAVACFIILAFLMYHYGPYRKEKQIVVKNENIENLINKSISNLHPDSLSLSPYIMPKYYKLRIHPYFEDPIDPKRNFTFEGKIVIGFECTTKTKVIEMNAANIFVESVSVYTNQVVLKSLSQVSENNSRASNRSVENVGNITQAKEEKVPIATRQELQPNSNSSSVDKESTLIPPKNSTLLTERPKEETTTITTTKKTTTTSAPTTTATKTTTKTTKVSVVTTSENPKESTTKSFPVLSKGQQVLIPLEKIDNNPSTTKMFIFLSKSLNVGKNYTLEIDFSGNISDILTGLYKASYVDPNGRKQWVINTNFKPIFARYVFPCFDDPTFKTPFEISIARKENMTAISNMPLKETESMDEEGWVWDHFERTPKMTTYSVAFSVGNYKKKKIMDDGTEFNLWAVGNFQETNYVTNVSTKVFKFLESFFGIRYPLPKLDFVVVPDLASESEDSWGLVSFRDQAFLVNPKSENWLMTSDILKKIAEQLSHQWFGKLVSLNSWSDAWLRHGMGKFLAYDVASSISSELGMLDSYVIENIPILYSDSLLTTTELEQKIDNIQQVTELFQTDILNKGVSILRMLNFTLTGKVFKEGVQNFLKTWSYKSTSASEFYDVLNKAALNHKALPSYINVKDFVKSWVNQPGYPVITVIRDYTTGQVLLNQHRFIEGNITFENTWIIPVSYITSINATKSRIWLNGDKEKTFDLGIIKSSDSWILLNTDAGFYRVNYDDRNWKRLLKQINTEPSKIPSSCRAQIIGDAFELAYRNTIHYETPLELTKYLEKNEREPVPWEATFKSFGNIGIIMRRTMYFGKLQAYLRKLIKPVFEVLGFEEKNNESLKAKKLRKIIVETACYAREKLCLEWSQKKFKEWLDSSEPDHNNPIPFTFRKIVICNAIKMGGESEWEFVWKRTLSPKTNPVDLKIMYLSLGCSRDPWIIKKYLHKSLNDSIALQDIPYVWRSITHTVGIDVGLQFIREDWKKIYDVYQAQAFNSIINEFFTVLSTKSDLEDLTLLYNEYENKLDKISPVMLNVVERIKTRIVWTNNNLDEVVSWFDKNLR